MKKFIWPICIVLIVALIFGGYIAIYQLDVSNHTGTLEIQAAVHMDPNIDFSKALKPGSVVPVTVDISNLGYSHAEIRQTLILSIYSPDGDPIPLNGTTWTSADIDLFDDSDTPFPPTTRVLNANRVVYSTEYPLDPSQEKYALPFFSNAKSVENTRQFEYYIKVCDTASDLYSDCVIMFDVITEGSLTNQPDDWQTLHTESFTFGTRSGELSLSNPADNISFCDNTSFAWNVKGGYAYLIGIGTVLEPDILIPDQVLLSHENGRYYEDPRNGQVYEVIVASDAFYDCDHLVSVVFEENTDIQNNQMNGSRGGMFENCDRLLAVEDIPDSVSIMERAFAYCVSMVTAPELPASTTDLDSCFLGCTALTQAPTIPEGVTEVYGIFQDCVSLVTAPSFPDSVTTMLYSFSGCSNLTEVPSFPNSLTSMICCFQDCVSLAQVPDLPKTVENLKRTFYRCTGLTTAPRLSNGVTDMTETFAYCTSLQTAPEIPASVQKLQHCFLNCASLSGAVMLPFIESTNPFAVEGTFDLDAINGFLEGCNNVEAIHIDYCDGLLDPNQFSRSINVVFTAEHQDGTVCPVCCHANLTTEIDGVTVVIDNIPEKMYLKFIDCFDNEIPDWLKTYCASITFTDDLCKYDRSKAQMAGFATWPEGNAYIQYDLLADNYSTIIHELAHTYDARYSTYGQYSSSSAWRSLHASEGDTIASLFYDKTLYDSKSTVSQSREDFAMAVEAYYCNRALLRNHCPGMCEYIEEFIKDHQ